MDKLSKREEEVLELVAHGFSSDEIANSFFRSVETVKRTIQNIKIKLQLQKATELTAYYWCRSFGVSFEERRNRMLAICAMFLFLLIAPNYCRRTRRVVRREEYRIEIQYYAEAS